MSSNHDGREQLIDTRDRIRARVVGRERELTLVLAAVAAGRDILLEGPPGTSKTTLLKAITAEWDIPLVFVEGNADLTPSKLVGHHNPARVLREDYTADNFTDGPLLEAMRSGGFLYIEEFNRAPEDTVNTLLTAMADRRIAVPRVGQVQAMPTFRVIASMNPYDNIGTTRLSTSVHDRFCRLSIGYQDEHAERDIVSLRAPLPDCPPAVYRRLAADAVAVTRATRAHEDIRQGSSVRGAIDLTLIAGELLNLDFERTVDCAGSVHGSGDGQAAGPEDNEKQYRETVYDAMVVALSGRIFLDETVDLTPEQVLRQIWEDHFFLDPAAADPG
jgi:MoxR-like ATPase